MKVIDFIKKNNQRILLLSWVLVQAILFAIYGVYAQEESYKYISQARILLATGNLETSNFWLYFTEIALIAFVMKFNLSYSIIVIIQVRIFAFLSDMRNCIPNWA